MEAAGGEVDENGVPWQRQGFSPPDADAVMTFTSCVPVYLLFLGVFLRHHKLASFLAKLNLFCNHGFDVPFFFKLRHGSRQY